MPPRTNTAVSTDPGAPRLQGLEPTLDFVYSVFGIESVGSIVLSPEVTVPSRC